MSGTHQGHSGKQALDIGAPLWCAHSPAAAHLSVVRRESERLVQLRKSWRERISEQRPGGRLDGKRQTRQGSCWG